MIAVDQFVPTLEPGAIGAHSIEVQRALRDLGCDSEIFAEHIHPRFVGIGHAVDRYARMPRDENDACLYHVATGSTVADFVLDQPRVLAIDHHNITPPEFFEPWQPDVTPGIRWGLRQLADLARLCEVGIADSSYNAAELGQLGCVDPHVVPILIDVDEFDQDVDVSTDAALSAARDQGGLDILFVGRVAPHKAQHDLIRALALYRRAYDPMARLRLVGSCASEAYLRALRLLAADLDVGGAVDFAGAVSPQQLRAYYRQAGMFVSASEHEGFCVPLLEAWHHDVPVIAYDAGAVSETLATAGVLLDRKEPARVAAAIARVATSDELSRRLIDAGRARLQRFSLERTRAELAEALAGILGGGTPR